MSTCKNVLETAQKGIPKKNRKRRYTNEHQ